jgi:hypothetical protein
MKKTFMLLLVCIGLISCDTKTEFKSIKVNDYSISLPDFLSEGKDLNGDASLQYQNLFKEFYVVVIDESKESFKDAIEINELEDVYESNFDGYTELLIGNLETAVTFKNKTEKETKINGLPAKILTFEGTVEGIDIYYQVAYIDGITNYYQIMTWTLPNKKDTYKEIMDKMFQSFKVSNRKKESKKENKPKS